MDKVNICKGCWIYEHYNGGCVHYKAIINEGTSKEIKCPCITCLVKMMCERTCLPLSKFRHLVDQYKKEKLINANSITERV